MNIKRATFSPEKGLFVVTILLSIIGLLFVFEASVAEAFASFGNQFYFVRQQAVWLVIGVLSMFIGVFVPALWWKKISPVLYVVGILLLITVFVPGLSHPINGARRWIFIKNFSFQPVEFIKFGMITFFAAWMEKHQKLGPFLFLTSVPVALLILQPDLGSALIVLSIAVALYFLAGAPYKTFLAILAIGLIALVGLIVISPYRFRRLTTFFNPDADPLGASFHIRQITLALGNGGIVGEGIGKSRQKFSYLPEASTDAIFAIVAEEVGFLGSIALFFLFFLYIHFGYRIVRKTEPRSYQHLLAAGILVLIGMQMLLNLSAIVALVPLTGIPLPFFSYGGTALVMVLFVTSILIGIGRQANAKEK